MATARRRSAPWRLGRALLYTVVGALALAAASVLLLRWFDPFSSAFMLEARVEALWHGEHDYQTRYRWVPLEAIAPQAAIAVIACEDQQFPFHAGFDFKSIRESVRAHERGGKLRGASTISQQVAKNLFLWSGRSFVRKGLEAMFTVMIEAMWPKERILEIYLNIAEFGRGVYGVQAAARIFFHKDASRLNSAESALLAVVLPNPRLYRVEAPSRYVLNQREWALRQMANLGGAAYLSAIEPH
ncbi:MAG TPA: monofunctional biosynthetic peptidoglycan transglycosylase [Steroidobacteraceae bacterium]|jgi:monofunctional biosynthetic peptidoglycan transglycosylase